MIRLLPRQKCYYGETLNLEFVYIEPGGFMMGSPADEPGRDNDETRHEVTLTKGYYIQTAEVTQGQWKAVMGNNPSGFRECGEDCPVERISWYDAQEFIRKLNRMEGGDKYRLPTEAEWEYACRAGGGKSFSWGDNASYDRMMFDNNSRSGGDRRVAYVKDKGLPPGAAAPVKSYPPNAWGLYDMHGNVWEWCQDWRGDYPTGPASGSYRILRGGGWYSIAGYRRSAIRYWRRPGDRYNNNVFESLTVEMKAVEN